MTPSARRALAACLLCLASVSTALAAGCPGAIVYEADDTSLLDAGWSGSFHGVPVLGWALRMGVSGCAGTVAGSCGQCSITGLIPTAGGSNQRCSNDTSIKCTSDAPCAGGGGHCAFYATPPNPIGGGGTSDCIINEVTGAVSGTVNVESGDLAAALPIRSDIYKTSGGPYQPCPNCVGDPIANDNVRGGTCSGGARAGQTCDANATSPKPDFGTVSFDCPPTTANKLGSVAVATQAVTTTTGPSTFTLSAASPPCSGFPGEQCYCDTCNNAAGTPCTSNADCVAIGASVCGGKRCIGGTNAGTPCTVASECPGGGTCGRPGEPTKPDGCLDDTANNTPACVDTTPVDGEGECVNGPIVQHCAAPEEERACVAPGECPLTANCVAENRRCFLGNGAIGGSLSVAGQASPRSGNTSDPTDLGALFCVGATISAIPNNIAGLPGPGRMYLYGRLTYADEVRIENVGAGATVSTDAGEGDGATPTDVVETSVTTPSSGAGGEVTILETSSTTTPPPGFLVLGNLVQITAPAGTAANPLALVFRIDGSTAPGQTPASVTVKRNGVDVPACTSVPPAAISPDPCVFQRSNVGDDIRIAVYTSAASDWDFVGPLVTTPTPTLTPSPTGVTSTPTPTSTPSADATAATPSATGPTSTRTPTPTVTATPLCAAAPDVCRTPVVPGKALISLQDKSPDTKDQWQWTWAKGAATAKADFGDPVTADDYVVCLYDGSGLRATLTAPAGGLCANKPCWSSKPKGFQYKDQAATPSGVTQLKLGAGTDGKAKIQVKGKGDLLPDLDLSTLASPLTVELRRAAGGVCWSAAYTFPPAIKNTAAQFKDKAD